ncbi:MAG: serine/threonine-protein phosphatase [Lachnospiraceae bacterium]|nr:serine/threonine-protein phosphatase [Lachnospiraceae bacterium]
MTERMREGNKLKRRSHILVEFGLILIISFGILILFNSLMYWRGILSQTVTNTARGNYQEAEYIVTYFNGIAPCEWLLPYWLDHPETMEYTEEDIIGADVADSLQTFIAEHGSTLADAKSGEILHVLSEEDKTEYAKILYRYMVWYINAGFESDDDYTQEYMVDGPMIACVKDGKTYIVMTLEENYPYSPGDPVDILPMEDKTRLNDDDIPVYLGDNYKWIERTDPDEKNYGAEAYPFTDDKGNIFGYMILGINTKAIESMNTEWSHRIMKRDIILSVLICIVILLTVYHNIIRPLSMVDRGVREYADNKNVDEVRARMEKVRQGNEVGRLADGISDMAAEIEDHIRTNKEMTEMQARADAELDFARQIQTSAVPSVFPPFPDDTSFGLFALMDTAKQVGGDFYDFFLLPDDKLAIVIADVSDKGVPAALFMMRAKTLIKTYLSSGLPVDEVADLTNRALCEDNEMEMFVTVWIGFLDLKTGVIQYVHGGHTFPVIFSKRGAKFVKKIKELMFGYFADTSYHAQTLRLKKGDSLFLYTDGVNEAMDPDGVQYGEERLLNLLTSCLGEAGDMDDNAFCESVCRKVSEDIDRFTKGCPQSDDITMLCVRWNGYGGK